MSGIYKVTAIKFNEDSALLPCEYTYRELSVDELDEASLERFNREKAEEEERKRRWEAEELPKWRASMEEYERLHEKVRANPRLGIQLGWAIGLDNPNWVEPEADSDAL